MSLGKVVIAMSGGVDSSVAAFLLRDAGYEVVGITMRLSTVERPGAAAHRQRCCAAEDIDDARAAADAIGIPHYVVNFEREFKANVIDYFVREYQRGRTPHPCIACNERVKFDPLLHRASSLDARYLATGHYARIEERGGVYRLLKAVDASKDQSYVLYNLGQDVLRRTLFPIGGYAKNEVRRIASQVGLPNAEKPDSQEICFIPNDDYRGFLRTRVEPSPGRIVDTQGNDVGSHDGIEFFTIGQRRNLGVQRPTPTYVVAIHPDTNTVVVGDRDAVFSDSLTAEKASYCSGAAPEAPLEVTVKYRYKSAEAAAVLYPEGNRATVKFREPQRALTPGQAVVFYRGDEVLGGGVIDRVASPAILQR